MIVLAVVAGCAAASIESFRDPNYSERIDRIFILIDHSIIKPSYTRDLELALQGVLSDSQLEYKIQQVDPIALDEEVLKNEIENYHPDGILLFEVAGFDGEAKGDMPKIIYDISIMTPDRKKRIWRAQAENSGGTIVMKDRMRKMVEQIYEKLIIDELVQQ